MSCVTLTAFDASMATTQLRCAACYRVVWPLPQSQIPQPRRPNLNWVVVTDENGTRRLRMQWNMDAIDG